MATTQENKKSLSISIIALILAVISLIGVIGKDPNVTQEDKKKNGPLGLLERIEETDELHAGYGVYPPYTQENPNTREVSGFSVDIINRIAEELKCKVVWHRLNWNTMSADLKRAEYDVIADPIFQTIPRAREFSFTKP